eukprot:Hpha_TRINITY_DN13431_c1_g1::TRINITY_DN13431_c1_g1_i1::g.130816::m.130816
MDADPSASDLDTPPGSAKGSLGGLGAYPPLRPMQSRGSETRSGLKVKIDLAPTETEDDDGLEASYDHDNPTRASVTGDVVLLMASSLRMEAAEAGVLIVALSLLITIMGTGVVTMPAAAARLGSVGFPLAIFFCGALFAFSCFLTARNLDLCGMRRGRNMAELGRAAFGQVGFWLATLLCFLDSWGALMGAFRVIGDTMSVVGVSLNCAWLTSDVSILGALVLAYPCTLPGTMYGARVSTIIALIAVSFLITLIVIQGFDGDLDRLAREDAVRLDTSALVAVTVVLYSFDCQANCYPLYRELAQPRPKAVSFGSVGAIAVGASGVLYWLSGEMGISAYTVDVPKNVLVAMPSGSPTVLSCQVAVCVSTFCLLPIIAFELTVILRQYLFPPVAFGKQTSIALSNLLTLGSSALVASRVKDAYEAFAITGAVAVTGLTFILPPLFFLRLTRSPDAHHPKPSASLQALPEVQSMADFGEEGAGTPGADRSSVVGSVQRQYKGRVSSYGSLGLAAHSPQQMKGRGSIASKTGSAGELGGFVHVPAAATAPFVHATPTASRLESTAAYAMLIFGFIATPILMYTTLAPP